MSNTREAELLELVEAKARLQSDMNALDEKMVRAVEAKQAVKVEQDECWAAMRHIQMELDALGKEMFGG